MPRCIPLLLSAVGACCLPQVSFAQKKEAVKVPALLKIEAVDIDGKKAALERYRGKVLLIVNVASECGATPQYQGLQELHARYAKDGLVVLGFPCNDFGGQEPGTEKDVKAFCQKNYGVKFDMFSKIRIAGNNPHPLYKYLTSKETNPKHAGPVRWNFEKFLIGRDGSILARFETDVEPGSDAFQEAIRRALGQ